MLKFLTCLLFVGSVYSYMDPKDYNSAIAALATSVHTSCLLVSGAKEYEIDRVRNGIFDNPSENIKKYVACAWVETGAASQTGIANIATLQQLEPEKMRGKAVKIWSDCLKHGVKTGGLRFVDQMWEAIICDYQSDPENFILL